MKLLHWELPSVCSVTHQSLVVCAPEQCPPFGSAENIYFHVAQVQAELWGVCLWHVWTSEYRGDLSGADWSLVFVSIVVAEVLTFSNEGVHRFLQKIIRGVALAVVFWLKEGTQQVLGWNVSYFILLGGPEGGRCWCKVSWLTTVWNKQD